MADREQTLEELVEQLPAHHRARLEYEDVRRLPSQWRRNPPKNVDACAYELEAALASAPAVKRVPVEVAKRVIAARDAMIDGDDMEVWHQLYRIADPDCTQSKPWAELERIAAAPTDGRE